MTVIVVFSQSLPITGMGGVSIQHGKRHNGHYYGKVNNDVISFGLPISAASYVFVLPNPPQGSFILDEKGHGEGLTAQDIILFNGNHWRKILTIAAKLVCPVADWRAFRDTELLATVTLRFSQPTELLDGTIYFFCGQQVQQRVAPLLADVEWKTLGEESRLQVFDNVIYCPYLDYRQYPNALIDCTRRYLQLAHPG